MKTLCFAFLISLASLSHAAAFQTQEAAIAHVEATMAKIAEGNFEAGLEMIKPYMTVPAVEVEAVISQTKLQLPAIAQRLGKSTGFELIEQRSAGKSLVRLVYLQKLEKHGLRWIFLLYQGSEGWTINTFYFDDKIHELFN